MRYNRIISYGRGTLPQLIEKSYDFLKSAFEDDSIIKANRLEDCLSILIEMQDNLNDYITEIKKKLE